MRTRSTGLSETPEFFMNKKTTLPTIDIVICVHNALEDVTACCESVLKTDYPPEKLQIILVDDGSQVKTQRYLVSTADKNSRIKLIRREKAGGYTKAANIGLDASQADYCVLLNSDTIVPRRWLRKMLRVFDEKPDVGIVGPVSNAASWQSVPEVLDKQGRWTINALPEGWSVDDMDSLVEGSLESDSIFPRVPLLNGFCLMVSKAVLQTIGFMDEKNFPKGFGEENDFCFRASDAGFGLMVSTNTYVYHAKSKSYGHRTRNGLSRKGGAALKRKYSSERLERAVKSMKENPILKSARGEKTKTNKELENNVTMHQSPSFLFSKNYDFVDFGCSSGGSIKYAMKTFGATHGVGIDISPEKVAKTRQQGFDAELGDVTKLGQVKNQVDFTIMSHFLEHLPSVIMASKCIKSGIDVAREFVFIQQPYFDADGYLFHQGFKLFWSDWSGHPNRMTSLEFHNILNPLLKERRISRFGIYLYKPIPNSHDEAIHPLLSPIDQHQWNRKEHKKKPHVVFKEKVFAEIRCLIALPGFNGFGQCESSFRWHEKIYDSAYEVTE